MTAATKISAPRTPKQLRIANAVFFFLSGFGYASWASRIPTIKHQLHLDEAQLGGVLFAMPIGLLLTLPVTGHLLSKYSSRRVMLFGSLFFSVVLAFIGLATSVWQLILVLFCFGVSRNLFNISTNAQAVAVQALYDRSIMANFHGIWSLAGFAGAAGGYFMVYYNIGTGYHLLGVSILLIVFTLWFIKGTIYQQPVPQPQKKLFTLPDKSLIAFSLICFASMACENTMYDWSAIYFGKVIHVDKATATGGFVIYMIAMTTGRFVGDASVNRFGIKNILRFSGVFIFCGLLLSVLFPYVPTTIAGFILVGLGVSCIVPMVFQMAGKSTTMSSGTALASISSIGYLGFLIVPPFIGFIAQAAGLRWSFGLISLLGALVIALVYSIKDDND
ncbi:MFS transporter [Mucilaginibacter corticis]|uniref:MFS transporter n=1 Tax=Mucilaginibacter corticis TaxID=2597670 RepID=A0A556MG25_9SPHI|nr:MFS transporter [Mucilaginibacter corticis]TSJ38762.1 MFS transporter [Mucilaginibacter corticis]